MKHSLKHFKGSIEKFEKEMNRRQKWEETKNWLKFWSKVFITVIVFLICFLIVANLGEKPRKLININPPTKELPKCKACTDGILKQDNLYNIKL
jgi:hypothetical protein